MINDQQCCLAALQTTSFTYVHMHKRHSGIARPTAMQVAQIARRLLEDAMAPVVGHSIDKAPWLVRTIPTNQKVIQIQGLTSSAAGLKLEVAG